MPAAQDLVVITLVAVLLTLMTTVAVETVMTMGSLTQKMTSPMIPTEVPSLSPVVKRRLTKMNGTFLRLSLTVSVT